MPRSSRPDQEARPAGSAGRWSRSGYLCDEELVCCEARTAGGQVAGHGEGRVPGIRHGACHEKIAVRLKSEIAGHEIGADQASIAKANVQRAVGLIDNDTD